MLFGEPNMYCRLIIQATILNILFYSEMINGVSTDRRDDNVDKAQLCTCIYTQS